MKKLIEGSIEWNVLQVMYCIEWACDPNFDGFSKGAALHTMDVYVERINAATKLANDWSW